MKRIMLVVIQILLLTSAFACATDTVEVPKTCSQCGMDRTAFALSRMLVVYADGARTGVCSIHCAAAEMQHNRDKEVRSLLVADYLTKELIDAKKASWVVGGKKQGVMTALAKWAFAREEDARIFVEENGGVMDSFDQAMKSVVMEVLDQAAEERAVQIELLRELK